MLDGNNITGLVLQVNHPSYGTLFAAMIEGCGVIISSKDEEGHDLPFFTTEQILKELERFGFYVTYDVKSNLPMNIISFLATIDNLGFDKITWITVRRKGVSGTTYIQSVPIAMKSEFNSDLLTFGCTISETTFNKKLDANVIMNINNEPDMEWDWLNYMANIEDILDENIDPTNDFETEEGLNSGSTTPFSIPDGYTMYTDNESEEVVAPTEGE